MVGVTEYDKGKKKKLYCLKGLGTASEMRDQMGTERRGAGTRAGFGADPG